MGDSHGSNGGMGWNGDASMMLMEMIMVVVMDVVVLVGIMIVVVIVVVAVVSMGYDESDDEKAVSVMIGKSHNCAQGKTGFPDASRVHMSHDIMQQTCQLPPLSPEQSQARRELRVPWGNPEEPRPTSTSPSGGQGDSS